MAGQRQTQPGKARPLNKPALVKTVDSVQATRGLGVYLRRHGRLEQLRSSQGTGANVVFELRERHVDPAYLRRVDANRVPFATAGTRQAGWSIMKPGTRPMGVATTPTAARPALSRLPDRRSTSMPTKEWASLGLNCAGAAIAWIGVAGTGALAPVTAGTSVFATAVMYAGALAGSGQCLASVYRISNAAHGRSDINDSLDNSSTYYWTMLAADGIGLAGVKGALGGVKATAGALRSTGIKGSDMAARALSRAQRVQLATELGLGVTKVGSRVINRVVRQRLLEGAGAVLGV